jgi:hypothetical protein
MQVFDVGRIQVHDAVLIQVNDAVLTQVFNASTEKGIQIQALKYLRDRTWSENEVAAHGGEPVSGSIGMRIIEVSGTG